jgi:hypothetical protein
VVGFSGEHIVLVDANVWVSRTLRDWVCLLHIHGHGMFTALWTEDILAETLHAVRRLYPDLAGGKIAHVRESIVGTFPDGRVRDFEIDTGQPIPDPFDRHVHAAAIAGEVDLLITDNVEDLRPACPADRDSLPYEVYTADEFFMLIADCQPSVVRDVIRDQIEYFLEQGIEPNLPAALRRAGTPRFAERVRDLQLGMTF